MLLLVFIACVAAHRPELDARYGASTSAVTQGINRLLARKDPDVVGVFAQLGYVDDAKLSAVLAANSASSLQVGGRCGERGRGQAVSVTSRLSHACFSVMHVACACKFASTPRGECFACWLLPAACCCCLQTLVVKTYEAISRLRAAAKEANTAVPSMLSYTLIQVHVHAAAADAWCWR